MGTGDLVVFKVSSHWKELATLTLTLEQLECEDSTDGKGCTVFYFTDSSTTYWIAGKGASSSPALHNLIEEIRLLELHLGCHLQVVHVPGYIMITQGTDGLSRGLCGNLPSTTSLIRQA